MIKINLNPRKKKRGLTALTPSISLKSLKFENANKFLVILLPVILIVGLLFYYFYLELQIESLQQRKTMLITEKEKLKAIENKINQLKKAIAEQEKQKEMLELRFKTFQYLADSRKSLTPKLNSIILPIPDGLWLESVEISKDSGKITGNSLKPELVAQYYKSLNISYKDIVFNGAEKKASPTNIIFYNFTFELRNQTPEKREGT
ncbi:PilN domain-containing protein [Sulfurihydrogenibium yellowstonense]|uniref:Fimbrial assembly protein n=1 Tax=Sulfurihydrogenibium yellowstonense SS-5 TaxID=432331 RepID=C4FM62_9AQUI|nr:PilN domain-containing protein [Sulfurihydrogenibium yellowstonense]EEP59836.1 Fimbrial assembly protein [Sulfurihydrogenibium yellowstonense SS-5]